MFYKIAKILSKTAEKKATAKTEKTFDKQVAQQQLTEGVRAVGQITQDGLLYVLKEEENGWLYVESGNVRGFVRASEVYTGDAAQKLLSVYQKQAKKKAEAQMRKVKELKFWIEGYNEAEKSVEELTLAFDFVKEDVITEEELDQIYATTKEIIENLELRNMLRREEDKLGAVLKINSGAGGTESQDWASMLMRMYIRWAEDHKYKVTVTNLLEGDEAGIKSATIQIEGDYAYGYLKSENGVHRLVRVSPFNAQGKRMTSFTSVFVVPLVDDSIEIHVNPADITCAPMLFSLQLLLCRAAMRTISHSLRICASSCPKGCPQRKAH